MATNNLPILTAQGPRSCGTCTLCCQLMAVTELAKPAGTRCAHQGRPGAPGCGIYQDRPVSCQAFDCGWLRGLGPESWRPKESGVIIVGEQELPNLGLVLRVICKPTIERPQLRNQVLSALWRHAEKGHAVLVELGSGRALYWKPQPGGQVHQVELELAP